MRVLVADDNADNRDLLARRLARQGWEVSMAIDGVDAVEKCKAEDPDIVLMDVAMPRMSGLEATRALRSDAKTSGVKIIAVTAHAMEASRSQCLEAGCNDFATKPVDFADLLKRIHRTLGVDEDGGRHVKN
jgi:two-component system, cell cycle response regulator DivK